MADTFIPSSQDAPAVGPHNALARVDVASAVDVALAKGRGEGPVRARALAVRRPGNRSPAAAVDLVLGEERVPAPSTA